MKGPVLVLGATSPIARAAAGALAARGHALYLASRDTEELARIAADLAVRHKADVAWGRFEATDFDAHAKFVDEVEARMGDLEGVLLAFGLMGDQEAAARDAARARRIMDVNVTAAVSILTLCAERLEARRSGFIVALSSVAGERGRRRNYPYGAAKGALSLFLQGLRARLHRAGVRVLTVKLGFVDTPMTFGQPGMFLVAAPRDVGERIVRALEGRRDVIYLPWFWRWVMAIVRIVPESVHKRLDY